MTILNMESPWDYLGFGKKIPQYTLSKHVESFECAIIKEEMGDY